MRMNSEILKMYIEIKPEIHSPLTHIYALRMHKQLTLNNH